VTEHPPDVSTNPGSPIPAGGANPPSPLPVVGIVMGSDSDWPVMRAAAEALDEFAVPYEADVVSAHRMPHEMIAYGASADARGLRVIIAGAGGAAHLPGMLASVTPLPVIGVPVPLANLGGLDSLLSIVQMPAGIPVATVAVGGARNAGLLAVRILAAAPEATALRAQLVSFAEGLAEQARAKGAALRSKQVRLLRAGCGHVLPA
jgi:5-(carboxyamino)imidazole ribonucleotide mutase